MAGRLRYWKEQNGRFYARVAVPEPLRKFMDHPRSELTEPLGGDRKAAMKEHPAAVARLLRQITMAEKRAGGEGSTSLMPEKSRPMITTADIQRATWQRYIEALEADEMRRDHFPQQAAVDEEAARVLKRYEAGEIATDPLSLMMATLDLMVLKHARETDRHAREIRLKALRRDLAMGHTHQIEHEIDHYLNVHGLSAPEGTSERIALAKRMMRSEIEALIRTLERDDGDYGGHPTDPVVQPPPPEMASDPVSLSKLWSEYLVSRMQAGFNKDGGKRQEPVIRSLRSFLKHDDARRVTKKDLLVWRDHLLNTDGKSAKTVSDIYLSTVRSLFSWAHDNERLSANVAATVRQPKPRKVHGRERGYTDAEALAVLKASIGHEPRPNQFGFVRETIHMTAAKRWAPVLCAFSGARISEITQLRKEDIRQEGDTWIMRITPDAGTTKTGVWRDVPLHRQIVEVGFIDFLKSAAPGPLFHGRKDPAGYARAAASVSDELAKWLRRSGVTPVGVQPNHAWRHRMKTKAREIGISDRVIDAIQGHAGRTAGDSYGDVTIAAKAMAIERLPRFELGSREV